MSAYIFALTIPILPIFLRRLYKKEEKLSNREIILRYLAYTLFTSIITTLAMVVLCDVGISFLKKIDEYPSFALKFLLIQLFAALLAAGLEWWYETRRLEITVDVPSFQKHIAVRFLHRIIPLGIYLLAAFTALLNVTLIFDNVLWGDEAYSANLMRNSLGGIMQIVSAEEPHPPLYYLWLKMWVGLLGCSGTVLHLASLVLFLIGLVLTVTLVRKRYGKIPASFFVVFAGMSEMCLTYNVEIRMYAMAFLGVTFCYYSAGRLLEQNKLTGWMGMVFWGLVAAYSHYYGLLSVVILMVVTCLLAVWRFGVKTWIRSVLWGIVFIVGYAPWLRYMLDAVNSVKGNWWLEKSEPLDGAVNMIFGGADMAKMLLPLVVLMLCLLFFVESAVVKVKRSEEKAVIRIQAPRAGTWTADYCILLAGLVTIVLTLVVSYLADIVYRPILSRRYVYPLGGVVAMMLVIGGSRFLQLLKDRQMTWKKIRLEAAGKCVLLTGIKDYRKVSTEMWFQAERTETVLELIGEPVEDMNLVCNGVKHLGWTVLQYYYPEAKVCYDDYDNIEEDDFWYFASDFLTEDDFSILEQKGYILAGYGEQQIATYPFVLYHFYKQ